MFLMIIDTLNIRGEQALKRRRIRSLIKNDGADVFLIQETKWINTKDICAKGL